MFDYVFSRSSPMIEGSDPLLVGASLLRFHPVEAAMVLTDGARPVHTDSKDAFLSG